MSKPSSSKRKSPEMDFDEATIKKALRLESGDDKTAETKVATLGEVMPSFQKNDKGVISNSDLEKLFFALCGDTGKQYDSDDSIISEIDFMDDEVIAAKDKRTKEMFDSLPNIDSEIKCVEETLNIGKESKEVRDARRKKIREMQQGLTTDEQKEEAERKRRQSWERIEKGLNLKIQQFTEKKDRVLPFMTCCTFSSLLEILSDIVSDEDDPEKNHRKILKEIDAKEFGKQIKLMGIRDNFVRNDKSIEEFILSKVRRILSDDKTRNVFNKKKLFGFDFTTKECLLALEKYYTFNKPKRDNGSSISPLAIHIRPLVKAAFHVARERNSAFVPNENLKSVLFD